MEETLKRWTPEELDALHEHYPAEGPAWSGWAELAPGRTYDGIRHKAHSLGLSSRQSDYRFWTPRERAQALEMFEAGATYADIGRKLGRSRDGVAETVRLLQSSDKLPAYATHRTDINRRAAELIAGKHLRPAELQRVYGLTEADLSAAMGKS